MTDGGQANDYDRFAELDPEEFHEFATKTVFLFFVVDVP